MSSNTMSADELNEWETRPRHDATFCDEHKKVAVDSLMNKAYRDSLICYSKTFLRGMFTNWTTKEVDLPLTLQQIFSKTTRNTRIGDNILCNYNHSHDKFDENGDRIRTHVLILMDSNQYVLETYAFEIVESNPVD